MNNLISINETDIAVANFLKQNNISFRVHFAGTSHKFGNEMDSWLVVIGGEKFDFYTGIGHRIQQHRNAYKLNESQINKAKSLKDLLGKDRLDSTIYKLPNSSSTYAVSPTQAGVLYCLLLDANGAEQNFHDWCSDYDYNSDSLSDRNVYDACCETLNKVRKIFTHSQREVLRELLQDY